MVSCSCGLPLLERKVIMKKYNVSVALEYRTSVVVEAKDIYEANAIAENLVADVYTVYNADSEEHDSFGFITAYEPEEV
jgi:hypothetical protein